MKYKKIRVILVARASALKNTDSPDGYTKAEWRRYIKYSEGFDDLLFRMKRIEWGE